MSILCFSHSAYPFVEFIQFKPVGVYQETTQQTHAQCLPHQRAGYILYIIYSNICSRIRTFLSGLGVDRPLVMSMFIVCICVFLRDATNRSVWLWHEWRLDQRREPSAHIKNRLCSVPMATLSVSRMASFLRDAHVFVRPFRVPNIILPYSPSVMRYELYVQTLRIHLHYAELSWESCMCC